MLENKKDNIMKVWLSKINPVLLDLIVGCSVFGVIGEVIIFTLIPIWYKGNLGKVALGYILGVFVMIAFSVHMYIQIEQSFGLGEVGAIKHNIKMFTIRAVVVLVATCLIYFTGFCNAIAFVCGMISLKVAAYFQPFTHKVINKIK